MKYTAIDFETAFWGKGNACSLGIVISDGSKLTDEWYDLIRPVHLNFDEECIRVNGIHPEDVKDKPEFPYYWNKISGLLNDTVAFAHNAPFDFGVLANTIDHYELPDINFYWGDTVEISRILWKKLPNHKLNTVAEFLNFEFNHHQALDDARACEWIVRHALLETNSSNPSEMMEKIGLKLKPFEIKRTRKQSSLF